MPCNPCNGAMNQLSLSDAWTNSVFSKQAPTRCLSSSSYLQGHSYTNSWSHIGWCTDSCGHHGPIVAWTGSRSPDGGKSIIFRQKPWPSVHAGGLSPNRATSSVKTKEAFLRSLKLSIPAAPLDSVNEDHLIGINDMGHHLWWCPTANPTPEDPISIYMHQFNHHNSDYIAVQEWRHYPGWFTGIENCLKTKKLKYIFLIHDYQGECLVLATAVCLQE